MAGVQHILVTIGPRCAQVNIGVYEIATAAAAARHLVAAASHLVAAARHLVAAARHLVAAACCKEPDQQ